jgi:hypothetical protein
MRTTIRLDEHLLAEAKKLGVDTGRTLTQVVEGALREVLARRRKPRSRGPVKLTAVGGRGVQPGVDLDDSAGLVDLTERRGHSLT